MSSVASYQDLTGISDTYSDRPVVLCPCRHYVDCTASVQMGDGFSEYRFSRHFNHLTYLGMWTAEIIKGPVKRPLYLIWRTSLQILTTATFILQMMNLYYVFGDYEKIIFNFCSSILVIAVVLKILWLLDRRQCVNELRVGFWKDFLELDDEEDFSALDRAYRNLNLMYLWGYGFLSSAILFIILSHYCAYFWGSSELPFAVHLPMDYPKALLVEALCVIYVASIAMEDELIGFTLVLQMNAHYEILINKLRRLDDLYGPEEEEDVEKMGRSNGGPAQMQEAKEIIKYCVTRHLQLMEYTTKLEYIYSRCMVLQLFVGSFLILMNGVELLVFVKEFNQKICSQMLIIVVLVSDLLFLCHFTSKLTTQCLDVGNAAYSTAWYRMENDVQKGLYMIMIGSRNPPKMTAGKLILVDLHTYMQLLRNILSWLMLLRQLLNQKK